MKKKCAVISGPMFARKTTTLMEEVNKNGRENAIVIKSTIDTRSEKQKIKTHDYDENKEYNNKTEMDVDFNTDDLSELLNCSDFLCKLNKTKLSAIDEGQFFKENLIDFVEEVIKRDKNVIVAGLDYNYKKEWFNTMKKILEKEWVESIKLTSI